MIRSLKIWLNDNRLIPFGLVMCTGLNALLWGVVLHSPHHRAFFMQIKLGLCSLGIKLMNTKRQILSIVYMKDLILFIQIAYIDQK
jgi:hypothetical protein